MLKVGTKVRVIDENFTHYASIGDAGKVIGFMEHMFVVEFDNPVSNGVMVQLLEEHEIEVVK